MSNVAILEDEETIDFSLKQDPTAALGNHYSLTEAEWEQLDSKLGKLCYFASKEVIRMNNAFADAESIGDIQCECFYALIRAAMYYKRQQYIIRTVEWFKNNSELVPAEHMSNLLSLLGRWTFRKNLSTRHSFPNGDLELANIIESIVKHDKANTAPTMYDPLIFDENFLMYSKTIIWRAAKTYGKTIKEEKDRAKFNIPLSECDFLDVDFHGRMNGIMAKNQLDHLIKQSSNVCRGAVHDFVKEVTSDTYGYNFNTKNDDYYRSDGLLNRGIIKRTNKISYVSISKDFDKLKEIIDQSGGIDNIDFNYGVPLVSFKDSVDRKNI